MDNDILINQARLLYVALKVQQQITPSERIDHLIISAYLRYQRRLNRCVLCYKTRLVECDRFILGKFCNHKTTDQNFHIPS